MSARVKSLLGLDLLNIFALTLLSLALSGFLLAGAYLDTTYADWMYHAFRAQSLLQHGFVSWDSVWDNGISYWRAYQMVPAALTAGVAWALHIAVPKAMIILTVTLYTLLHVGVYAGLRTLGRKPYESFAAALLSFMFSGYWLIMKDYSISFAAALVVPMLVLWYRSHNRPAIKLWFTFVIGLSVYVHPLLALSFGGLWLFDKLLRRDSFTVGQTALELAVMVAPTFFYAFGLTVMDKVYIAPYQLTKDFIYSVAGSYKTGQIFYLIIPVMLFVATFVSRWLTGNAKILFWYTTILGAITLINLKTPALDLFNRFQLTRTIFFVIMSYVIVFGETVGSAPRHTPKLVRGAALAILFGLAVGQSLSDTSTYASTPVATLPDPVQAFVKSNPNRQITGGIFIANSTVSSYNFPGLRFSNGYNDQLLPQLVNDRLSELLREDSPTVIISDANIVKIRDTVSVLGIQYIFLPQSSPYIPALTKNGFTIAERVNGQDYRLVVIKSPGEPHYGSEVSGASASVLGSAIPTARPGTTEYSRQLDVVIARAAAIKANATEASVKVAFPAPDALNIALQESGFTASGSRFIYLNQSYSKLWAASVGTVKPTAEGMMMVEVPAGTTSVTLAHSWGQTLTIQLGLMIGAIVTIAGASLYYRRRPARQEEAA